MQFLIVLAICGLVATSAWAQQTPTAPPTDEQLSARRVQALQGALEYEQALSARLRAEWQASETRAKWAVGKLWKLPEAPPAK